MYGYRIDLETSKKYSQGLPINCIFRFGSSKASQVRLRGSWENKKQTSSCPSSDSSGLGAFYVLPSTSEDHANEALLERSMSDL